MDYKSSGVDIDAGNEFVKSIPIANKGFGGMFQVPQGYEEPVLVSGTDGVGTKIDIAQAAGDYTTIGIDLVAPYFSLIPDFLLFSPASLLNSDDVFLC